MEVSESEAVGCLLLFELSAQLMPSVTTCLTVQTELNMLSALLAWCLQIIPSLTT